jgi:hypothetical protein
MRVSGTVVALMAMAAAVWSPRPALADSPANDPYAALRLYDGKWDLVPADSTQKPTHLVNHCAKTGSFFACEQVVDGKSVALVVFLPLENTGGNGQEYRTDALLADASAPGDWSTLTIVGSRWVYAWEDRKDGKKTYWRNINVFSGPDAIHFEIQRSDDGAAWTTRQSGDERRVK